MLKLIEELGGFRKKTWLQAIENAKRQGAKHLIETGCFRGTDADGYSTVILARLAKELGTILHSYELNESNIEVSMMILNKRGLGQYVKFHAGDSVTSLAARSDPIDFAYLDSFDCGLGPDFSPCQEHQLAELEAILPILSDKATVLMDDYVPATGGKPLMAMKRLDALGWSNLATVYQVLYSSDNTKALRPHKFAVICGHMREYVPLAVRTLYHNRAQYCLRHGYDLRILRTVPEEYSDGSKYGGFSWGRLKEMIRLAKSGAYEWVWCVGADTLVTNMTVTLESLVADACGKAVIICGEAVAPLQADSFLVRCSPTGIGFLEEILATYPKYKNHIWIDNQAMIDLRKKHEPITFHMPQHRMNAFDYSLFYSIGDIYRQGKDCYGNRGQWQPGDFLIHWPAQTLQKRLELLIKYQPKVIR